jgi:Chaperone of endosialidase
LYKESNHFKIRKGKTMNSLIQLKTIRLILVVSVLGCFALLPRVQAVNPPPDGGYPGGNTAEGQNALFSLTTGTFNTAVGFLSGQAFATGNFNTAIGAGALLLTTADENTATGAGALLNSSGGFGNSANGAFALFNDTDGDFNTAVGDGALFNNTTGGNNTASGFDALASNSTAGNNTAIGVEALLNNTTGGNNTAIGFQALSDSTGFNNVALGDGAGSGVTDASNVICIGAFLSGLNQDNSCFISNIFGAPVGGDGVPVSIDSSGKLGTFTSSRRYKKDIKPIHNASEAILSLKPVTFHYKTDKVNTEQFGLIAEEVAEVNPDLVVRDKNGELLTVRYEAVNAMLLNEFIKEHNKVEQQTREIRDQKAVINRLANRLEMALARIEEQDLKIRRVNEQIEVNQFATGRIRRDGPMRHIVRND